jgi:accessory gene regulator protein AgrB
MSCRVHLLVHSVLLVCEAGVLGVTFAKLASDHEQAKDVGDAVQAEKSAHNITLTILSAIFTLISFSLTVISTYFSVLFSRFRHNVSFRFLKRAALQVTGKHAKHSSTVTPESAAAKGLCQSQLETQA